MKKLFALTLAILMLVPVFGCVTSNPNNDTPTTQPTESTAPQMDATEPTVPTEATEPPETTDVTTDGNLNPGPYGVALSPETLAACEFEQWLGDVGEYYRYGYVGQSNTVTLPGGGLTITFPEGWMDDLAIVWHRDSEDYYWTTDISGEALIRAWIAHQENIAPEDVDHGALANHVGVNYVIRILGIPNDVTNVAYDPRGYLGKDENYTYVFVIPEFWEDWWDMWNYREDMIEALGEDTYYDLLGDLVITEEMAKEMIAIVNPISE